MKTGAVGTEVSGTEGTSSLEADGETEAGKAVRGLNGWLHIDDETSGWTGP